MSKKFKSRDTTFNIQTLIRLAIFITLLYFLITFFANQQNPNKNSISENVLGEQTLDPTVSPTEEKKENLVQEKATEIFNSAWSSIPESNRQQIENIDKNPFIASISSKISEIQEQSQKSFDTQIKNLKKEIAKRIYEQVVKDIDSK